VISTEQLDEIIDCKAVDSSGSEIGKVGQVYFNTSTDRPEWATVHELRSVRDEHEGEFR
jgi:sporulation protein YlmC with PRC-barrel domain